MRWHATRLSPARIAAVEQLEQKIGLAPTAKRLGASVTTIDRILGGGELTRSAAERLGPRIDALGRPS